MLGVEFAPQPAGVRVERPGLARVAEAPDVACSSSSLEKTRVGSPARTRSSVNSFFASRTSRPPTSPAPRRVDDQLADPGRALAARRAAAQDGVDPGPQLPWTNGLTR